MAIASPEDFNDCIVAFPYYIGEERNEDVQMVIGTSCTICWRASRGWNGPAVSNAALQLMHVNTLLAHAHDVRCASLVCTPAGRAKFRGLPLDTSQVSPQKNRADQAPSDMIWNALFGQDTILDPKQYQLDLLEKKERCFFHSAASNELVARMFCSIL